MGEERKPPFQLYLEPANPIELSELTGALGAIAHQFETYATAARLATKAKDAKLFVSSVKPGSIDIGLLAEIASMGPLLAPHLSVSHILAFALQIKELIDKFRSKDPKGAGVSVKDCDDAGAIIAPVANHGGQQTINVIQGDVYQTVLKIEGAEAKNLAKVIAKTKAELQFPDAEVHQRVAMIWDALDRAKPRAEGVRNPDKVMIEEIDPKPRPVFFEDQFSFLKPEMLEGVENPYRKVYFVDVSVSRVSGKVVSYKVTGFHGSDDLDEPGQVA